MLVGGIDLKVNQLYNIRTSQYKLECNFIANHVGNQMSINN